jgi:hypothetical protein
MSGDPSGKNNRGVLSMGIASSKSKSDEAVDREEMLEEADIGRGGRFPFLLRDMFFEMRNDGNRDPLPRS